MTTTRLDCLPPLSPSVYVRRRRAVGFPLDQPACALYARARHGLWHGVRALGLEPGDEVLVPAYHHGSEVEALRRAGLVPRFYDATATLEPDAAELESLLPGRVRALYLVHTLGFPLEAPGWRRWADERGLLLLEDVAQAWPGRVDGQHLGSHGDLAIFCLYKTLPVPDGGALLLRAREDLRTTSPGPRRTRIRWAARRHAQWLASRSPRVASAARTRRVAAEYLAERDFDLGDPHTPAQALTRRLLHRLDPEDAARKRRANYRMLLERLGHLTVAPFDRVPGGSVPFAFPIAVDAKARLLRRLAAERIVAIDFWAVPHPMLSVADYPGARERRERTVALPVHQELRPRDLRRIADVVLAEVT